jgi:hypothetical protein
VKSAGLALLILTCNVAGCGTLGPTELVTPRPAAPQVLQLTAKNFAFSSGRLHAVADRSIVIAFRNLDENIPHNFALWRDDTRSEKLFHGELIEGVSEIRYEISGLASGEYYFECHPHLTQMNGYLIVE